MSVKNHRYNLIIFILISWFLPNDVSGQHCVTLDQVLHAFSGSGPEMIMLRENLKSQFKQYQINRNIYKPSAKLDLALPYSNSIESVISGDGSVNYLKRNYLNPSLQITTSKKIPLTGGEIGITGSLGLYQNFILGNKQYNANWFNIYVSQPIFAYNAMKFEKTRLQKKISIDSIQYLLNKETKLKGVVESILDYEVAKKRALFKEDAIVQARYGLLRSRVLYQNGRILYEDTLLLALTLNRVLLDSENIQNNLLLQKLSLSSQFNRAYDYTLCDLMAIPKLSIDTGFLKQLYLRFQFAKELTLDSLDIFENCKKVKNARGINVGFSAGTGANQTSEYFNQLLVNPSQRQNMSLNASIPITGWQSYKRSNEIALIQKENYLRTKETIYHSADIWAVDIYNRYHSLLRSYQLNLDNLTRLQLLSKSALMRYEAGKILYSECFTISNEITASQENLLDIIKQLYLLRFELRANTL